MRRLAALIIGVATAQPVQNYYGNADPHGYHLRPVSRRPRALPYRPTYKPSLRGSDDDDCVDDEDWSYTTKEGDVFTCDRVAEKTKRCTIRFSETASGRTRTTPAKRRAVLPLGTPYPPRP